MFGAGGCTVAVGFDPNLHRAEGRQGQLFSRGGGCQNLVEPIVTDCYTVGHAGLQRCVAFGAGSEAHCHGQRGRVASGRRCACPTNSKFECRNPKLATASPSEWRTNSNQRKDGMNKTGGCDQPHSKIKLLASKERAKRPRHWMPPPRSGIT
jgi:hypothetical protein